MTDSVMLNAELQNSLSRDRAKSIKEKVDDLQRVLQRYKKLRKRWKSARNIVTGVGITIGVSCGVGALVTGSLLTSGIAIPILVPTIIGGIAVAESAISGSICLTLIKRRIHKFNEKAKIVSIYANRLYHFYHKAVDDKAISLEEMEEFKQILTEYEQEMNKISGEKDGSLSIDKIRHQAALEVQKERETELLAKFKEEARKAPMSSFRG